MKICFLDIDGVCIPLAGQWPEQVSDEAAEALHALRDAGYLFALHSSWRQDAEGRDRVEKILRDVGIELYGFCEPDVASRREAILIWLANHFAGDWGEGHLCIDDMDIAPVYGVTMIRCDPSMGLRLKDVEAWV